MNRIRKSTTKSKFVFDPYYALVDIMSNLSTQEYEGCCGSRIIFGFPEATTREIVRDIQHEWEDRYTEFKMNPDAPFLPSKRLTEQECLDLLIKDLDQEFPELSTGLLYSCILNQDQKWLIPYLENKGFRVVSDNTINKETGNKLFMLVWDKMPAKLKKRRF